MKILAIGDLHGSDKWKEIIAYTEHDHAVIMGDYFDHPKISAKTQLKNFKQLIDYKQAYPYNITLLVGNHDYHYMPGITEKYSGHQCNAAIESAVHMALDARLLQMAFQYNSLLFTHAGVSKTWYDNTLFRLLETLSVAGIDSTADLLNILFHYKPQVFRFTPGKYKSPTGDDVTQSPIWIRPTSLAEDLLPGFIQIVGHTWQKEINVRSNPMVIDTMQTSEEFLTIDITEDEKYLYLAQSLQELKTTE